MLERLVSQVKNFPIWSIIEKVALLAELAVVIGVIIAMYELIIKLRRERKVDSSSISILTLTKEGGFEVYNNGAIASDIELHVATYTDGKVVSKSQQVFNFKVNKRRHQIQNLSFHQLLSAKLNASEKIVFYPFDINSYEIFVFAGVLKLVINGKFKRYYLTTFTGKRVEHAEELRRQSHPQFSWVIRDIFENT
jgi:hypothetical protein